jgi:vacuolar-type H+-ATPase subunit E/Vma4
LRLGRRGQKISELLREAEEEWLEIAEEVIAELEREIPDIRRILAEELSEKKEKRRWGAH